MVNLNLIELAEHLALEECKRIYGDNHETLYRNNYQEFRGYVLRPAVKITMKYKLLNTSQDIRESIYRLMIRQKIRKVQLADEMDLSYPSILNKIENPGTFKVSELLKLCNILNVDINELLIKY